MSAGFVVNVERYFTSAQCVSMTGMAGFVSNASEGRDEMKILKPTTNQIVYSKETLYHFICGECKKWWTISMEETPQGLYCPHCGIFNQITLPAEYVRLIEE
jgi:DNA-directed RNA polymerase subunit RPC12/RpoP